MRYPHKNGSSGCSSSCSPSKPDCLLVVPLLSRAHIIIVIALLAVVLVTLVVLGLNLSVAARILIVLGILAVGLLLLVVLGLHLAAPGRIIIVLALHAVLLVPLVVLGLHLAGPALAPSALLVELTLGVVVLATLFLPRGRAPARRKRPPTLACHRQEHAMATNSFQTYIPGSLLALPLPKVLWPPRRLKVFLGIPLNFCSSSFFSSSEPVGLLDCAPLRPELFLHAHLRIGVHVVASDPLIFWKTRGRRQHLI